MMRVIVNNEVVDIKIKTNNLLKYLEIMEKELNKEELVVEEIEIDGDPLEKYNLEEIKEMTIDEIEHLSYQTRSINSLFTEGLEMAANYLPKLNDGLNQIIKYMDEDNKQRAFQMLGEATEGISWYLNNLLLYQDYISDSLKERYNLLDFNSYINEINGLLSRLNDSLINEDCVLLQDILLYELKPVVKDWERLNKELLTAK